MIEKKLPVVTSQSLSDGILPSFTLGTSLFKRNGRLSVTQRQRLYWEKLTPGIYRWTWRDFKLIITVSKKTKKKEKWPAIASNLFSQSIVSTTVNINTAQQFILQLMNETTWQERSLDWLQRTLPRGCNKCWESLIVCLHYASMTARSVGSLSHLALSANSELNLSVLL